MVKNITIPEDTEWQSAVADLLDDPQIWKMNQFSQHGGTSTLQHCVDVSYMAWSIASKRKGQFAKEAARAGLLHDFFLYDWHQKVKTCENRKKFHAFTHGGAAMRNAAEITNLSAREADAIKKHMFPLTAGIPATSTTWIIVLCDKICALREVFSGKTSSRKIKRTA